METMEEKRNMAQSEAVKADTLPSEMTRAEKLDMVRNAIAAQSDEETESTLLAVRFLEAGYALGKAAEKAS